jgi:hypothetical protein
MTSVLIGNLTGIELEYEFAKACGFQMVGKRSGPFALGFNSDDGILIFGAGEEVVSYASFSTNCSSVVLSEGQKHQAILAPQGAMVACRIGDVEAIGDDYTEALMRAVILHNLKLG